LKSSFAKTDKSVFVHYHKSWFFIFIVHSKLYQSNCRWKYVVFFIY